ncbi:Hypothetical predicted protein [Cloeon dipterum]|uniref:Bee-milk protein n=1 Tax=Cloeon dipterum TaxID=197152 RepID=A0A8S1D1B0_9INSE|nr:Hypothetical predicted protein [Cloeon dipterum]
MSPFVAAIFLVGLCLTNAINFTTVYEWEKFDFVWPSGADSSIGQLKYEYKPHNVFLRHMAVFGERLFLSLNKNSGNPATLVWLPTSVTWCTCTSPKLAPFPSLDLHKTDNCETIQEARGIETDPDGRFWVLDNGSRICPSKIWIFNLLKNDKTERVHQFPRYVVSHSDENRNLRDIVLDKTTDDSLAYITDSESEQIVVYSRKLDKSWSLTTPEKTWVSLALSPKREARQLFLGEDNSKELYSMSVSELKNEDGSAAVKLVGEFAESPFRMVIDSANVLYAALLRESYISQWNISEPFREHRFYEVGSSLGSEVYQPFTFALDTNGTLWMTQRNQTGGWSNTRHKLIKAAVGASSYLSSTPKASTTPRVNVNEATTEVVKSTPTLKSKIGTLRPALISNETSGGCAGLAEDYRKSQSLNKIKSILICLLVCCLVLSCTAIAWLTLRMRRMQTSLSRFSMDNNRAEMSVFPEDPVYDDVGPENSNEEATPDEPLYAEVGPEPLTSADHEYASARTPSPVLFEEPLRLGNTNAGKKPLEPENIYDDVGPEPSSGPSRNQNSVRKPTESVQYLEMLP